MTAIEINEVSKTYGSVNALKNISLNLPANKVIAIVGASGAGKTTLLQVLSTLEKPDQGKIVHFGKDISTLKGKSLANYRNQGIGFVFQFHQLLPEFTAHENVCLPGYLGRQSKKEVEAYATELLNSFGLASRLNHKPDELSGGEKQRVAVARALINKPKIIFADEPSGNLDSGNAEALHKLFFDLKDKLNCTFVVVTHNRTLANQADLCISLKDGAIEKND